MQELNRLAAVWACLVDRMPAESHHLRVDPTAYARQREARLERAAELRAARLREQDALDELAGQAEPARPPRRRHVEVAPGWTQHTCKKTGKLYYHQVATGKTTWIRPSEAGPAPDEAARSGATTTVTTATTANGSARAATIGTVVKEDQPLSEAEFETWLAALKGRTLTGSQARRLASVVQRFDPASLSSLKQSMRSKRETTEQLRTRSASEVPKQQQRRPRRPEWNGNFATEEDDDRSRKEEREESNARWRRRDRDDGLEERKEDDDRRKEQRDEANGRWRRRDWDDGLEERKDEERYRQLWRPDEPQGDEPDDAAAVTDECERCGRVMSAAALDKMLKLHGTRCCPKCAPAKRRRQFNTAAHRARGIAENPEDRQLVKKGIAAVKRDLAGGHDPKPAKWKAQSDQLRQAMKSMRAAAVADRHGRPPPPVVASEPDPTLVPCPHCGRRFNQQAADRHIPKCQDIKAKPKMLKRGAGTPGPVRRHS